MATHETRPALSKRPIPLSLIGKVFRVAFNLAWLTLSAWMVLLLLSGMSGFIVGSGFIDQHLQETISSMTSHAWNASNSLNKLSYLLHIAPSTWQNAERWHDMLAQTKAALEIALPVSQLIYLRCQLFFLSGPLLLSIAGLGLLDGLVQRDIRKYQSTRESSLFFHRSKAFLLFFFYSSYFLFIRIKILLIIN